MMASIDKIAAARAFLRSLNISLKFVRLYGFGHGQTAEQIHGAWGQLQAAVPAGGEDGLLVEANGAQLLLNGTPVPAAPVERSIAQLLTATGVGSVQFLPEVTQEELGSFVQALCAGNAKGSGGDGQISKALAGVSGIRVNAAQPVAENTSAQEDRDGKRRANAPSPVGDQIQARQKDPEELPQMQASQQPEGSTAEGASPYSGAASPDFQRGNAHDARSPHEASESSSKGNASAGGSAVTGPEGATAPEEPANPNEEILSALRLLAQVAHSAGEAAGSQSELEMLRQQLGKIPEQPRRLLQQALATLAGQMLTLRSNDSVLLRLAEHLAVRFALDRYERGAGATEMRQLLDRMSDEIGPLRKISGMDGKTMVQAGIRVGVPADLLDRQFWSAVPKSRLRAVIASPDGWCVPPRNIRQQIEEMARQGEPAAATGLESYARGVNHRDAGARRRAAVGLAELADLYAAGGASTLIPAIRCAGAQLSVERDEEAQGLVSTAFVRLAERAGDKHLYRALLQALDSLSSIEDQRPAFGQNLRERLGLNKHTADFLEEAIRTTPSYPPGLTDVIERIPGPAAEYLRSRFNRTTQREESQRVVEVVRAAGDETVASLRENLQVGQPGEAAETVGLLSRLDAPAVEQWLGSRVGQWPRQAQDRALRLLAGSGAPERGRLLLAIFDQLDPFLKPLAADEIGMSGEASAVEPLLHLAAGDLPKGTGEFLRLKAVEALGRLHAAEATEVLRGIVEAKKLWHWLYSSELRIAAMVALRNVAPDWVHEFFPHSGFSADDLEFASLADFTTSPWFRQRRYPRVHLAAALPATATFERGTIPLEVHDLSLSGGLANGQKPITPGTQVVLRLGTGLHPVRALAVMRGMRAQELSFEFEDMGLEERARLRRLIREHGLPVDAPRLSMQDEVQPGGTVR